MPARFWPIAGSLVLAATAVGGAGCARPRNPWVYAEPPAVTVNAYARPVKAGRIVVAIAQFANPDAPQLDWSDVGLEMTRAMRRAIYNDGDFEVRIAPEIERKVTQPGFLTKQTPTGFKPVEVDYVLTGQVTDFHHTAALPKDASRWGLFGRRKEAVVAIEWKVVDVRARRVVAADHTYGTAEASRKKSIDELYEGLDVSAYLFWNTPLGRAGHKAVDKTIARMRELLPTQKAGLPTVLQVMGPREISIKGGWKWGLAAGQEFYMAERQEEGLPPQPIYDAHTGRPLMVRIRNVRKDGSTAWLLGMAPQEQKLEGAILTSRPPPPRDELADRDALADIRGGDDGH
ncbi:MAG: CsgG/HfaB family protein [Planctomycetota bacterium]|jgi:curli biogenesis system outer membrane secretion channel CsgG